MSSNSQVKLVGIVNITPDSFSDGGNFIAPNKAVAQALSLFDAGATYVDLGAESTNPWSHPLSEDDEWKRLKPVLTKLAPRYKDRLSVDTYHPTTALKALSIGVAIINDVTMFRDPAMLALAASYRDQAIYIVSHLSPAVRSIAEAHATTPTNSVQQVKSELLKKRSELINSGVPAQNIILDPGIGFGKTPELNTRLLRFAEEVPDILVMIGYSRKRFLGEKRMEVEPNLKAGRIAIASGAAFLRVHDIQAHRSLLSE